MNNEERIGRLTSSEIAVIIPEGTKRMTPVELVMQKQINPGSTKKMKPYGFQAGGQTYITKKRHERLLKRNMPMSENVSQAANWGKFMEIIVFNHLGMEFKLDSKSSLTHPDKLLAPHWAGSPDLVVEGVKQADIKAFQLERFCRFVDVLKKKSVFLLKEKFTTEYWQLVSNSILCQVPNAEAIAFCPYVSEIPYIQEKLETLDLENPWPYQFIANGDENTLSCIPDGGYYKNITTFEFEVPQEDIDLLTSRVHAAIPFLEGKETF